jgi:cyclin C
MLTHSRCCEQDFISFLGVRLGLRQRVIATAQVFFKRFYLQYSFVSFDPRLAAPTMLFVAAKVEECPINAKVLLSKLNRMEASSMPAATNGQPSMPSPALVNQSHPNAAAALAASITAHNAIPGQTQPAPTVPPYLYEMEDLLEMEFAILVGLKYDLIVYHPYKPMMQYLGEMKMNDCLQMAQDIVNDTYRLDLPLLHPPYVLAIASIYMACNFLEKDYRPWFKTLHISQDTIIEITRELLLLWDDQEAFCSQANQTHLLALLTKLNEKKFLTLAQQRPAGAASSSNTKSDHALNVPHVGRGTARQPLNAPNVSWAAGAGPVKRSLEATTQPNAASHEPPAGDPKRQKLQ